MSARLHRLLIAMFLLLTTSVHVSLSGVVVAEGGVGIYPVEVVLEDAVRGGEYLRMVTVINQEDTDLEISFAMNGDIGPWLSIVDEADNRTELESVIAPARTETRFIIRIAVPAETENGRYTGSVLFEGAPVDSGDDASAMGVSIGIASNIVVDVTGTQNLSARVLDLWVDDAEAEQPPVRLHVRLENDGNVQANPIIEWAVRDASGARVGEAAFEPLPVQPGLIEEIVSEWDSSGLAEGSYTASVKIRLRDTVIHEQEIAFDILPVGTLTREGLLERIILDSEAQVGGLAKVVAVFRNIGQIDTKAIFAAEVYRDDVLVGTVESQERLVVVGELALIEAFVEIPEEATYRISGKVNYEGKVTETQEMEFTVGAAGAEIGSGAAPAEQAAPVEDSEPAVIRESSALPLTWIVAAGVGALAVVALAFVLGQSRSRAASTKQA